MEPDHHANTTRLIELVKKTVEAHPLAAFSLPIYSSDMGRIIGEPGVVGERDMDRDRPKICVSGRDGSEGSGDPCDERTVGPEHDAFQLRGLGEVNRSRAW